jgi:trimeric autotransporter adhesin
MLQATTRTVVLLLIIFFSSNVLFARTNAAPANDNCGTATVLTLGVTDISGTVKQATASSGVPFGTCTGTPDDDVWYKFTLSSTTSITVTLSSVGANLSSSGAMLQLLSGNCPSGFSSITCGNTEISASNLVSGTYYVRVYSGGSSAINSGDGFSIIVTGPPSNDDCGGATNLTSGVTNSSGTVWAATASSGIPVGCATGTPDDDVWYKITTSNFDTSLTINLTSIASELTTSGARVQLFNGTCGSLSLACGTSSITASVTGSTTYYIRVYSAGTGSLSASSGSTFSITATTSGISAIISGRTNEVFQQTTLSGAGVLQYPWEVTYGPDEKLWITEARGYKVHRMDPNTGVKTTVLDLNSTSTDLTAWGADSLRAVNLTSTNNWNGTALNWPQGGLAGLAIHPQFLDGTGLHDFVYISYVHRYLSTATGSAGIFFRNKIVRFTYNSGTGKLGAPEVVCDTIPGGQDHNSQRMIIAPVTPGGTNYLFYAAGDLGAGQYANRMRPMNAQNVDSYEGKILRFNLEPVAGSWIPADNPYSSSSAVYSIGIRNNQGFAYDTLTNKLYGASHGPYSDDEINVIESRRNYGHPLIQGFVDGNYNGNSVQGTTTSISAGAPYTDNLGASTCPPIGNEATNRATIDANGNGLHKEPLFSAYAVPLGDISTPGTVAYIWRYNPGNAIPAPGWPTESWSGLDLYSNRLIPGWKRSLVAASLKWGRLVRLKLSSNGEATAPTNTVSDTTSYFNSQNRFRDLAFAPNGKDVFVIMDNSSTTSGPGSSNPAVASCAGCVQKYTFLGYLNSSTNRSSISASIDITSGVSNTVSNGTTITIDATNSNLWVPITGPDGNIMAEIKANGNILGTVTSKFYTHSGPAREDASKRLYLNRSMTITPQNQPSSTVNVRLYVTSAELTSLIGAINSQGTSSGVSSINDIKIFKNDDVSPAALTATTATLDPAYADVHSGTTNGGYVLQADITSFSSFYFGDPDMIPLPLELISFNGKMKENKAFLQWETANESNSSHFEVERSTDAQAFEKIGLVSASGNSVNSKYTYTDKDADKQGAPLLYYRLKIVDKDGKTSYSQVISLSISSANIPVVIYPNPVSDALNFRITMPQSSHVILQVTDMQGRVMYKQSKFLRTGTEEIIINTKSWPSQSYSVMVTDSRKKILVSKKIIKM